MRQQRILNRIYMHTNIIRTEQRMEMPPLRSLLSALSLSVSLFFYPNLEIKMVKYFTQNLNFIWGAIATSMNITVRGVYSRRCALCSSLLPPANKKIGIWSAQKVAVSPFTDLSLLFLRSVIAR